LVAWMIGKKAYTQNNCHKQKNDPFYLLPEGFFLRVA